MIIVNYRPVLVEGVLEASYPSSHTMLVCVVMGSAIIAVWQLFKSKPLCISATVAASIVMALTLVGRLLSGVHWATDIIAALILSAAMIGTYLTAVMAARDLRPTDDTAPETSEPEMQASETEDAE